MKRKLSGGSISAEGLVGANRAIRTHVVHKLAKITHDVLRDERYKRTIKLAMPVDCRIASFQMCIGSKGDIGHT